MVAYLNLFVGVISVVFNCGLFFGSENRQFNEKLEALKARGEPDAAIEDKDEKSLKVKDKEGVALYGSGYVGSLKS